MSLASLTWPAPSNLDSTRILLDPLEQLVHFGPKLLPVVAFRNGQLSKFGAVPKAVKAPVLPPVLERAGIRLDLPRRQARRDGLLLDLTPKEFAVLEVLMRAEGAVVSAEELLEKAWDENADPFTNAVRVAVMTLRRKLGQPPVIETVPGSGYRLGC